MTQPPLRKSGGDTEASCDEESHGDGEAETCEPPGDRHSPNDDDAPHGSRRRRRHKRHRAAHSSGTAPGERRRDREGDAEKTAPPGKLTILPDHDGSFTPTGAQWRGITWQDVPGHDANIQKLNFTLLKRGMLRGHRCCARLHGEALKQRLREISERNRDNSQVRTEQDLRRRSHKQSRKPP